MKEDTETSTFCATGWRGGFDPMEDGLRADGARISSRRSSRRSWQASLGRGRYERSAAGAKGLSQRPPRAADHRHVRRRDREACRGRASRARTGKTTEWRSKALPRYQRLTKKAEALIAAVYLAGTNTRRVKRALFGLFEGAVSKDVVSRAWRKVKVDWDAWCARSLAEEDIVRLILDGTVMKARMDRKATASRCSRPSACAGTGRRSCSSIRNMGGESTAAWRAVPRRSRRPRPEARPTSSSSTARPGSRRRSPRSGARTLPIQRCTVHKHRNLLAHAPKSLHDELTEDYRDMIYAETTAEIETRRKAFLRKWRLKCPAVADSLEEAGDRLFTFTRLDPSQWKSARTTNAIERLHEEFRRRIKTQTVLPDAETASGSTAWVLIRRRNSSCRRSMALVVRATCHCDGSSRVKARLVARPPSRLSATAGTSTAVAQEGLRRCSIAALVSAYLRIMLG